MESAISIPDGWELDTESSPVAIPDGWELDEQQPPQPSPEQQHAKLFETPAPVTYNRESMRYGVKPSTMEAMASQHPELVKSDQQHKLDPSYWLIDESRKIGQESFTYQPGEKVNDQFIGGKRFTLDSPEAIDKQLKGRVFDVKMKFEKQFPNIPWNKDIEKAVHDYVYASHAAEILTQPHMVAGQVATGAENIPEDVRDLVLAEVNKRSKEKGLWKNTNDVTKFVGGMARGESAINSALFDWSDKDKYKEQIKQYREEGDPFIGAEDPWHKRLPGQIGELAPALGLAEFGGLPGLAAAFGMPEGRSAYAAKRESGASIAESLTDAVTRGATETAVFYFNPLKYVKTINPVAIKALGGEKAVVNKMLTLGANTGIGVAKGSLLLGTNAALKELESGMTKWAYGRGGSPDIAEALTKGWDTAVETIPLVGVMHGIGMANEILSKTKDGKLSRAAADELGLGKTSKSEREKLLSDLEKTKPQTQGETRNGKTTEETQAQNETQVGQEVLSQPGTSGGVSAPSEIIPPEPKPWDKLPAEIKDNPELAQAMAQTMGIKIAKRGLKSGKMEDRPIEDVLTDIAKVWNPPKDVKRFPSVKEEKQPSVKKGILNDYSLEQLGESHDKAQSEIDNYEDKLVEKYGDKALTYPSSQAELAKNSETSIEALFGKDPLSFLERKKIDSLYQKRQSYLDEMFQRNRNAITNGLEEAGIEDKNTQNRILNNVFVMGEETPSASWETMAAEGSKILKNKEKAISEIAKLIASDYAKKNNYDLEGLFGPMSALTDKGKAELLSKWEKTANDAFDAISKNLTKLSSPEILKIGEQSNSREIQEPTQSLLSDQGKVTDIPEVQQAKEEAITTKEVLPGQQDLFNTEGSEHERLSSSEKAMQEAESARPEIESFGMGGGGGPGKGTRERTDTIPDAIKADRPEVEERLFQAHGVKRPSFVEKVKEFVAASVHRLTRTREYLLNEPKFDVARESLRLMQDVGGASQDSVARTVAAIVDPLGPQQLQLFERASITDNLLHAVDAGQPLRFGFKDRDEIVKYKAKLDELSSKTPEVQKAIETRRAVVKELVQELVDNKLLPKSSLENTESYFHQQVLSYMEAGRNAAGGTKPRPIKRSFQKKRAEGEEFGEEYDYNTSYIEAEMSWMTDAKIELAKEKRLAELTKNYDKLPLLKEQAKKLSEETGNEVTWQDVLRKDSSLEVWHPKPGNVFFKATTIPEKLAEQLQSGIVDELNISAEDLKTVLAMGGARSTVVFPKELVKQLDSMQKDKPKGPVSSMADELMKAWKVWSLLNPKRAISYNIRNLTGDADPIIAAAPEIMRPKYEYRAATELRDYFSGQKLGIGKDLQTAKDLGVISAGMTATEIPDIKDLAVFKRFSTEKTGIASWPQKAVKSYFDTVKKYTEFRESVMRYSAFLYYKEKLTDGTLKHYGASKKGTIDNLNKTMGTDVAAAKLSRDLLGDYGNRTVFGDFLRKKLLPFYSFQEINLQRFPRLVMNSIEAGEFKKAAGMAVVKSAAVSAALTMRIGALYAAMWAYNNLFHSDEEKDLSPYDQSNPHINLGRNADGSVSVFRNVGSLGDFLEWFGLNDATQLLKKYADGQISMADIATNIAKAPINKVAQSIRPDLKAMFEVPAGKSRFPDVFNPRTVDTGESIAGIGGLQDEYKWMKGVLLGEGERTRPHYWQRWLVGVNEPKQNALTEMYDLREDFLKKKGASVGGNYPISKFKNAREAVQNEDFEAFKEWKASYLKSEGNTKEAFEKFKASTKRLDPIQTGLNRKDEIEFETKFLNSLQRQKLKVARDYAKDLQTLMIIWWKADKKPSRSLKK